MCVGVCNVGGVEFESLLLPFVRGFAVVVVVVVVPLLLLLLLLLLLQFNNCSVVLFQTDCSRVVAARRRQL